MSKVQCTTVTYVDPGANSNKFYRTYVVDNWCIKQWGRVGAVGQWAAERRPTETSARLAASDVIDSKIDKGYSGASRVEFDYDTTRFPISTDKTTLIPLDTRRQVASPSAPAPAAPAPAPAAPAPSSLPLQPFAPKPADRHAEFTDRVLAAITQSVTDPHAAMVELAVLREQFEELQQIHDKAASYLNTLDQMLLQQVQS